MNWIKYSWLYFFISALVIVPGMFSLLKYGLKLSIEFTGGSSVVITNIQNQSQVIAAFSPFHPESEGSSANTLTLRTTPMLQSDLDQTIAGLRTSQPDIVVADFETVGPAIGQETIKKTIFAILISAIFLLVYITSAFKQLKYGVCAILAMFHDSAVLLGSFSLLGHFYQVQVDLLFVTALLTILSFSVHDTIVVYDRIRELSHRHLYSQFSELANQAISETMIRSLNNSLTVIFMLLALFLMGGASTKYFTLALLIGSITGAYSSPFNAVPLLVVWHKLTHRSHSS